METKFRIVVSCFILSVLIYTSSACNTRKTGESRSFQFYYFEGSYHVIPEPATENIAMSVVGCTNLAKPEWIVGEWNFTKKFAGGECVILFGRRDCKSARLDTPKTFNKILNYSEINSFHLCTWKAFSNSKSSKEPFKKSQYVLYNNPHFDGFLSNYDNVDKCTNLHRAHDKKVSSVISTSGNCVHLYELQNCDGATLKANPKLLEDLTRSGWANRASSIKACGMELQAKITTFRPTSTQEDLEGNRVLRKTDMETSQPFVNNGSSPILGSFETKKSITDIFIFSMIPGLNLLESAEVTEKEISVEHVINRDFQGDPYPHICFPDDSSSTRCVAVARMIRELKQAYQFHSSSDGRRRNSHHAEMERAFLIKENLTIPPCSSLEVESSIIVNENMSLKFELGLRISGENRSKPMTSDELRLQISSTKGIEYLKDLNDHEIFAKVRGSIMATVGVRSETTVRTVEDMIPGCTPASTVTTRVPKSSMWNDTNTAVVQNKEQIGFVNPLTLIIGGIATLIILSLCLLSLCIGRNIKDKPSGKEFQVIRLGGYVLTMEFACCKPG